MLGPVWLKGWGVALATVCLFGLSARAQESTEPAESEPTQVEAKPEKAVPSPRLNLRDLGIPGLGGGSGSLDPTSFRASFRVQEGTRRGTLAVTAEMEEGWHVYSVTQKGVPGPLPTKIKVTEAAEFRVLGPFQPDRPPHVIPPGPSEENPWKINIEEHHDQVTWTAPIELTEGVKPEDLQIAIRVDGQVCKNVCEEVLKNLTAKFAGYDAVPTNPGEYRPDPKFEAEVVLKGHIEPAAIAPGGQAKLVITAEPTPGWHIYAYSPVDPDEIAKPTLIALAPLPAGWSRSPVKASAEPKLEPAKDGQPASRSHEEPVSWTITLTVPGDTPEGEHVVSGYIGYQTCKNQGGCLPPQMVAFRASVPVGTEKAGEIPLEFTKPQKQPRGGSDEPAPASQVRSYTDVAKLAAASPAPTGKVDWAALAPIVGFGLLGGMILNLMPCVLPVIGLKVLSFAQQGGQSRSRVFMLNLWFAAGLILVFVLLATAAAFLNLSWGQQFTYTWFKVTMVIVVFAFALSFLGVWEVPIPGFAQSSSSDKLQKQEGLSGAFFKGIFTTLLATPCSGPFLGPVFAYTLAQPPIVTYIIFTSVGLGMAAPYLVIGAFPGLVKALPKPGPWMDTLKQLMGFVLLGTVVYLFSTINADWFIPTLALMMATWLACWIIGKVPVYEDVSKQLRAWGVGVAIAAAIGWASFTFLGPVKHLYQWEPFTPEAVAKLQAEGKTVMVDFTADWCLTCQWNFQRAINTHAVKEVVEKYSVAPLLADWTDRNETIRQQLETLNSRSIPVLAIYPAGKPGDVIVLRDVITEKQLIDALQQAGPSAGGDKGEQVARK